MTGRCIAAPADQARHNEKVKEAIKGNLADIVAEEAIVTSDGNKAIKVPIRSLELPHFRYDPNRKGNVGQGEGIQVGDVLRAARTGPARAKVQAINQVSIISKPR